MAKRRQTRPDGPLTVAERNALITGMLAEYPQPLALLMHSHPGTCRRAEFLGLTAEELDACCRLGLVTAARLFDPAVGAAFSTYASYGMRQAVESAMYVAQRDHDRRGGAWESSLSLPAGGWGRTAADLVPDHRTAADAGDGRDLERVVRRLIDRVPGTPAHRLALRLRWGVGCRPHNIREAARKAGLSPARVQQIVANPKKGGFVRAELSRMGLAPEGC